ncbi:MAG: Crp/Fnr family transcriptional regulator [Pseudomonadota bacterium]|nr:Crp/Fnr family transcriptional regulator [Pseudomonadota bacterium]
MIDRHLMKLRARDELSGEEEQAIRAAVSELREYPADKTIIKAKQELHHSLLLLDGLASRYKDLSEGQRQVTELHVGGDFVDLHGFTLKYLDHNVLTLTPCTVAIVLHEDMKVLTQKHPHLARLYWFSTNLDAAIHREWEVSLGRRSAISRLAHLFCEIYVRLGPVGLADAFSYDLRLTQTDLSECLGLTPVHVNRSLKELREQGLVDFRAGRVDIKDMSGLERVAEFDPAYLYLEKRPR